MVQIMKNKVEISKTAWKNIQKIPKHIAKNFQRWVLLVEDIGILDVRRIKEFHDEPLSGDRAGQRSVRLSRAYRVFYIEDSNNEITIINVLEVTKHEY